jgi:ribosomal protein S18 acetylase RimI-like enzyme
MSALEQWVPAVARAAGCGRWAQAAALQRRATNDHTLLYRDRSGLAYVRYSTSTTGPLAHIDFLAVAPEHRRLGIGSRAVLALERRLRRKVKQIVVGLPDHLGLAFYFWLRLGFRPLLQHEWPAESEGTMAWLVRELG